MIIGEFNKGAYVFFGSGVVTLLALLLLRGLLRFLAGITFEFLGDILGGGELGLRFGALLVFFREEVV